MHFIGRNPSDKGVLVCLPAQLDHELLVAGDERAILVESGAVIADLGPGRHHLTPARIPALQVAGDLAGVQIFLVRTVSVPRPVQRMTQPVPVDGYNVLARVELDGSCQIQVTDPRLLLSSLSLTGSEAAAALDEAAGQAVRLAVTQALIHAGAPLLELCTQPPAAFLEEIRALAAEALAPHGATVSSLELTLRLDDEAQGQLAKTMPPAASAAYAPTAPAPSAPSTGAIACPKCGSANAGGKYCVVCGAPLAAGCSACGALVAAGARFCSGCGKPVTLGPRRCGACGAELAPNAKFCSGCGAKS